MANPEKDKEIVNLKCSKCGTPISIKFGSWRRTKDQPHYCRKCRGEMEHERINNLSEEERAYYLEKKNEAIQAGWAKQTAEQKAKISQDRSDAWAVNEERKEKTRQQMIERWKNCSPEKMKEHVAKLNQGKFNYWNNPANREYHSQRAREKWYKQSKEEQERILKALNDGRIEFYENLTLAQREEMLRKQSISMKKYWDNLSEEEKQIWNNNYRIGMEAYRKKLSENNSMNNNELEFADILDINKISYEVHYYNKTEHPDFKKLFPVNTATGSKIISPFHEWDFMIHTKDEDILVDIDGSVHNPKNKTTGVTEFNDSKRPYQTDGLTAYAVLCYDDKITMDSLVINIKTEDIMTLRSLIFIISWMNLSDKDKDKFKLKKL